MWSAALLRFIRRRIVLAAIFCMSLTYFLISLMHNGGALDADDFEIRRERPLLWHTVDEQSQRFGNDTTCRNSVQGKVLLVDDRGVVCQRADLLVASGCCDPDAVSSARYNCETCDTEVQCCSVYERCVSCCLNPDKRPLLEEVLTQATGRQRAVFATVSDHFELCLAKCRTDSHSVQHENQYRRPTAKHCYGRTFAHESQRDVANSGPALGVGAAAAAVIPPPVPPTLD